MVNPEDTALIACSIVSKFNGAIVSYGDEDYISKVNFDFFVSALCSDGYECNQEPIPSINILFNEEQQKYLRNYLDLGVDTSEQEGNTYLWHNYKVYCLYELVKEIYGNYGILSMTCLNYSTELEMSSTFWTDVKSLLDSKDLVIPSVNVPFDFV